MLDAMLRYGEDERADLARLGGSDEQPASCAGSGPGAEGVARMQGLLQAWNFNQPEALRAFKMAEEADPGAPMVYFGQAYALGPGANRRASLPSLPSLAPHTSAGP